MFIADFLPVLERAPETRSVAAACTAPARLGGLDGLRALAVAAVVFFHADVYWARGGYLGVDLFFIISGFLITGLLARELEATGRLRLGDFYWRRAKRLLPASWLMMTACVAAAALFARDALPHLRTDVPASLLYVTNWALLHSHTSYFEATGRPPLLQHLWSLAIEEQFYIVWAPLTSLVLPRGGRRALSLIAVALGVASAIWMAWLAHRMGYPEQGDASRLYFGTDTHGFALLFGATLGLAWQPARKSSTPGLIVRGGGLLLGLAALAVMGTMFAVMGEETPTLYPWGFLLAALAGVVLVATATHPGLALGRWLDARPLRWIGERSYGIYLWHWPVFMLTRPGIDLRGMDAHSVLAWRIVATLLIAALSYRFVEMPIRQGAIERIVRDARSASRRLGGYLRGMALAACVALAFGVMGAVLWHAPAQAGPAQDVRDALNVDAAVSPVTESYDHIDPAAQVAADVAESLEPISALSVDTPVESAVPLDRTLQPGEPNAEMFGGEDITAVGDSVLLGSSRLLKATLPGTDVHATIGWQAADVIRQLKALKSAGSIRAVALVHLGTNGYVTEDQLRQILSMLSDCKRVVLVNTHVPRRWMEANNTLIDRVAPDFPNVVVVRWSDTSENQPDYFVSDGVHLTAIGQRVFVTQIMRTGHLARENAQTPPVESDATTENALAGDLSPTLVLAPQPVASNEYWHKLALCETDANWKNQGRHSGGLGISVDDWKMWGGDAFAPTPADATPEQQIEVANRMSTQGGTNAHGDDVKPVGFSRWRCVAALGRPHSASPYVYTRESVLAQTFHVGQRGDAVRDLQRILGEGADGVYTAKLRKRHRAYLQHNGLPEHLAGADS